MRFVVRMIVDLVIGVARSRPPAEMITVSLIALLLLALVAPSVLLRREQARQRQAQSSLQQIGQSLSSYHDTFQKFPAGSPPPKPSPKPGKGPQRPARTSDELISPL